MAYTTEFDLDVNPDMSRADLATAVAKHFGVLDPPVNEDDVLLEFMHRVTASGPAMGASAGYARSHVSVGRGGGIGSGIGGHENVHHGYGVPRNAKVRDRDNAVAGGGSSKKRRRRVSKPPPIPIGTRVCARVKGNWIMARTTRWSSRSQVYEVVDEDAGDDDDASDSGKAYHKVSLAHVLRLTDPDTTHFSRGERVLALFPQTTSFYAGDIVQVSRNGMIGVRFDDDEEDGRLVRKRPVPAPFVIRCPVELLEE